MDDLRSRFIALIVIFFVLYPLFGCQGLLADPRYISTSQNLIPRTSNLNWGTVFVGAPATLSDTIYNPTRQNVTISQATVTGGDFQITGPALPVTIAPGRSALLTVSYAPKATGRSTATLVISSTAPNPSTTISLLGTAVAPGQLSVNPSAVSFGSVKVGTSQNVSATFTNSGGSNLTISQATVSSTDFTLNGCSLPLTLAPNQSKAVSFTFAPKQSGTRIGTVSIAGTASLWSTPHFTRPGGTSSQNIAVSVPLNGTGTMAGQLVATPGSLNFGSVQAGKSQTLSGTLTNSGGSSVTIAQASVTGAGYNVSGLSLPLTLAAGQSAGFTATFAPQSVGTVAGDLAIVSTASNPSLDVPLSGAGIASGVLTVSPANLAFGSVQVGSNQKLSATLSNTGGSNVTVTQATATGTGFSVSGMTMPMTLASGQSASLMVTFAPQTSGAVTGNLSIGSDATNATASLPLSGTGIAAGSLSANPASLIFGNVQTGSSQSLSGTLTNSGGSSVTITQASATGTGFTLSGLSLPVTLAPGQNTSFSVKFAPQSAGSASGSVSITSDAPSLSIPLSGTGVTPGALTANPASLSFGNVQTGNSQSLSGTLTNSGGSSVTITQASATGTGFTLSGLNLPITLAAGQSASFSVKFAPQSGGSASGSVSITSDAPALSIPLSGTGVTPGALAANPTSLSFGSVQTGSSQVLSGTLTNSGGAAVTITQASAAGTGFTLSGITVPVTVAAGQSTSFNVTFAPQSSGSVTGSVSITSNAPNPTLSIPLSGTGVTPGAIAATPSSVNFGSVQVGNSNLQSETVKNSGGSSVTISQATVSNSAFTISGLSLPLTLTPNQSFTFGLTFTPQTSGNASGNLVLTSNAPVANLTVSLSGVGTSPGQLTITPASLNFGSVTVGTNQSLTATLSATGSSVSVSSGSVTSSDFTVSGMSFPTTIAAGQSKTFSVVFTPQSAGSASATLSFASNAANTPTVESLTGSGVAAPQHSVTLSWNASTSAVAGYNVYRGSVTGGPYSKINSSLDVSTSYVDDSVQSGQAYFYVTTAVDSKGAESVFSNEVRAAIPTP